MGRIILQIRPVKHHQRQQKCAGTAVHDLGGTAEGFVMGHWGEWGEGGGGEGGANWSQAG